jgi:hypothetical protein
MTPDKPKRIRRTPKPISTAPTTPPAVFRPASKYSGKRILIGVVHCATREVFWLPHTFGKLGANGMPKGYRVAFSPGDTRDFDADGRPWHDEVAALRQWSILPEGMTVEARCAAERERLALVPDFEQAVELVEADAQRAKAAVPVLVKGTVVMKRLTKGKSMGLPRAPKGDAQPTLFALPPAIKKPRKPRAKKAKPVFSTAAKGAT